MSNDKKKVDEIKNGEDVKNEDLKKMEDQKKKADEKKKADKQADEILENADFVRKDTRPGVYSTKALGKLITIRDRQHYYPKSFDELKFCESDPELIQFDSGKPNKKKK